MLMAPSFETLPPGRARRLLWGWAAFAVAALAVAGLMALLLVLSRTPVLEDALPWPVAFFQKGLVVHVALSSAIWFLAVLACFAQWIAASAPVGDRAPWLGDAALALAVLGAVLVAASAFRGGEEASLNDYIPAIVDPVFYAGLAAFGIGVLAAVLRMLIALARAPNLLGAATPLMMTAGILYVAALAGFLLASSRLDSTTIDYAYNELLMWGGGHMLQFVNLALLLTGWSLLTESVAGTPLAGLRLNRWVAGLAFVGGLAGIAFFGVWEIDEPAFTRAFTDLQWALAPPAALFAVVVGHAAWRRRDALDLGGFAGMSLIASLILFAVGGAFGMFVDGADLRTPAHYHGVIGGINLAFVGVFYTRFLPLLGRDARWARLAKWQIVLYALGQLLFVVGMFAAGGMGAGRKTVGSGVDVETASGLIAATVRDVGGAIAVIGGVLFIVIAIASLLRRPPGPAPAAENDGRAE